MEPKISCLASSKLASLRYGQYKVVGGALR
jgi:hypothetical protein